MSPSPPMTVPRMDPLTDPELLCADFGIMRRIAGKEKYNMKGRKL